MRFMTRVIITTVLMLLVAVWYKARRADRFKITPYTKSAMDSFRKSIDLKCNHKHNIDFKPINTTKTLFTQNGLNFTICQTLEKPKMSVHHSYNFRKDFSKKTDPFMGDIPEGLVIAHSFNEKHMLLLNKYAILPKMLLIVAKGSHFETQNVPLDFYDMEGVTLAMRIVKNPVIFFNCGQSAGASQPHKHIQVIPIESFDEAHGCHLHKRVIEFRENAKVSEGKHKLPEFNFKHELRFLDEDLTNQLSDLNANQRDVTKNLLRIYKDILKSLGIHPEKPQYGFNFIVTKTYMLVIARSTFAHTNMREDKDLPPYRPNSMAFLGQFYSRTDEQSNNFVKEGFMNILEKCSVKEHSSFSLDQGSAEK
ncbi:unnamed protein product [Moneuplotes crassus]|uniref:ATP adenylyltransferase n=1 Tax=Euplotes crassus TaxID=5936 RepID=A0AAD1XE36_EUPCR|nr:unnamed protein product [Moneuplotes crassus]